MKLTLNKTFFNQLFFIICVIIPFFNNYELSFMIWGLAIVISIKKNYSIEFISYLSIFILILLFASLVGMFHDYISYYIIRDVTYLLKPIMGLLIGYQLFSKHIKNPFQFVVYAGIAIAIIHLCFVSYGIILKGARSVSSIRQYGGYFNDYEVYTLIILLFYKQINLGFSKRKTQLFILILAISSFFYLARTNFIQFVILYAAMKGFLVFTPRTLKLFFTTVFLSLVAYAAIYNYNPVRNGKGLDEFLYKIKIIPTEAFSTKIKRDDFKNFNDNYRSYENIRTVEQLSSNNTLLFGEGIGSRVDLKQKVFLGDMLLRYISILHNGFMTVLLKTGIIGILIYLISIFFFFKKSRTNNPDLKNIYYLLLGTGVFLIVSNWVFLGFYNLLDTKSLLIGFLFAYKHNIVKNERND